MKKIIALMVAMTVIISILNISVYADDTALGGSENGGGGSGGNRDVVALNEFEIAFADVTQKYVDGDITYTEWNEQQNALLEDFYSKNTSASGDVIAPAYAIGKRFEGFAQKIGETVSTFGDDARQRVADWWNGVTSDVPTETVQTPTTDYMGRGATMYIYDKLLQGNGSYLDYYNIQACDYIVIEPYNGNGVEQYKLHFYGYIDSYSSVDVYGRPVDLHLTGTSSKNYSFLVCDYENGKFTHGSKEFEYRLLYGDVRYVDGTQFPTGEEFEISTKKDFDEMPAPDLDDLLNDFAEELERQMPDLSTIEGLLKAIYARMGKLDSDNDNALLSAINASILKLVNADKDKPDSEENTNEELVNTLLEIRDMIKEGDFGTSPEAHGHEISGTVYNVIPLDKNFLNKLLHDTANLKVEYEGKVYYLEDCGCLKIGDKYYTPDMNYDSYAFADYDLGNENISLDDSEYLGFDAKNPLDIYNNLSYTKRKKIDNIVNSIYQMVTYSIPYHAITLAFTPFEVIIFNTAVPEDIVLNFNSVDGVGGFSATILSVSFFQNEYVAKAMGIIKPFLMVVIGYCWLKVMRRKVVSM